MIVELNTKSDLFDLANKKVSGIERNYLVSDNFRNKLDKIVYTSNKLINKRGIKPYIEVKYDFGRRNKRIEIVFIESYKISICKITNTSEFDKDYFELLSLIEDMKTKPSLADFEIKGVLFFTSLYNIETVESFLLNQKVYFEHLNIDNI